MQAAGSEIPAESARGEGWSFDALDDGGDLLSSRLYGFSSFSLETLGPLLGNLHALLDI